MAGSVEFCYETGVVGRISSLVSMMFMWYSKGFLRPVLVCESQATLCLSRTLYKPY